MQPFSIEFNTLPPGAAGAAVSACAVISCSWLFGAVADPQTALVTPAAAEHQVPDTMACREQRGAASPLLYPGLPGQSSQLQRWRFCFPRQAHHWPAKPSPSRNTPTLLIRRRPKSSI